ncbi:hypothetical protein QKC54_gp0930 [Megavirus baoshan]|uniref:DUF5894 domain-containing protein n=1 Tax=Megavirus baoshan TaxID=2496520 RepID=A0A3Q8U8F2_9VIRU|nr:hypothetical protein QKC54_gp0930 [Megavirus baoshan]AZL89605.1 hypothetical protein Mb0142 [Megavirus baoshan]
MNSLFNKFISLFKKNDNEIHDKNIHGVDVHENMLDVLTKWEKSDSKSILIEISTDMDKRAIVAWVVRHKYYHRLRKTYMFKVKARYKCNNCNIVFYGTKCDVFCPNCHHKYYCDSFNNDTDIFYDANDDIIVKIGDVDNAIMIRKISNQNNSEINIDDYYLLNQIPICNIVYLS